MDAIQRNFPDVAKHGPSAAVHCSSTYVPSKLYACILMYRGASMKLDIHFSNQAIFTTTDFVTAGTLLLPRTTHCTVGRVTTVLSSPTLPPRKFEKLHVDSGVTT